MRSTITAVVLFKSEEEFLEMCVSTLIENVERVVLVDNESTDGSTDIAKRLAHDFPNHVEYHFMPNDFDRACEFHNRNQCLKYVHTDWVFIADADQLFTDGWRRYIKHQLVDKKIDAIRFRYNHLVGSYEHTLVEFYEAQEKLKHHPHIPLFQTVLFRMRPDLECIPACRADKRFKEFHHGSFDPSMVGRTFYNCGRATCFHYGFSKRNMLQMLKYRVSRGDYEHDEAEKQKRYAQINKSQNPFMWCGPVTRVAYGKEHVPTVMKNKFGNTYLLELDKIGNILSRTEIATGKKL